MLDESLAERITAAVDRDRLVGTATALVDIPSPTGRELEAARHLAGELEEADMEVTLQPIEEGRANAVGRRQGSGEGPSLMFNGHLDTSYSGDEPWLTGPGFEPGATVRDGSILGLGIMNMKGAVACYVEAVRALADAGVGLRGDLVVAGVAGEIEKTQWSDEFVGAQYRGYGAGTRYLVTHGVVTDAAVLGEPTEEQLVLGHWGTLWTRISTSGPFVHTAFSAERLERNSIVRMQDVLDGVRDWIPRWRKQARYRGRPGVVNIGAVRGGFPWRASRTPVRTDLFLDVRVPPTMPMREAVRAVDTLVGDLQAQHPEHGIEHEVFVTAPGADLDDEHPIVDAVEDGHIRVHGSPPEREWVYWGSDASTLTRYGIAALNYGPISSALPGPEGESVPIDSLERTAAAYALTAASYCGIRDNRREQS